MVKIVVVMGVAGSGKTTLGTTLADAMHCAFLEGDSLHPPANVDEMSHGIPLTDADRAPWLAVIHARLLDSFTRGECLVVGCSALKQSYRTVLAEGIPITWVYLKGSPALIRSRLQHRTGHYMKADMLASQFEALEEPSDALVIDVSQSPGAIVEQILTELRGPTRGGVAVRLGAPCRPGSGDHRGQPPWRVGARPNPDARVRLHGRARCRNDETLLKRVRRRDDGGD